MTYEGSVYEREERTIPERLGFDSIPYDRELAYSVPSYMAQYGLYRHEAEALIYKHGRNGHFEINRELHLRYINDEEYRARIDGLAVDQNNTPIPGKPKREVGPGEALHEEHITEKEAVS